MVQLLKPTPHVAQSSHGARSRTRAAEVGPGPLDLPHLHLRENHANRKDARCTNPRGDERDGGALPAPAEDDDDDSDERGRRAADAQAQACPSDLRRVHFCQRGRDQ